MASLQLTGWSIYINYPFRSASPSFLSSYFLPNENKATFGFLTFYFSPFNIRWIIASFSSKTVIFLSFYGDAPSMAPSSLHYGSLYSSENMSLAIFLSVTITISIRDIFDVDGLLHDPWRTTTASVLSEAILSWWIDKNSSHTWSMVSGDESGFPIISSLAMTSNLLFKNLKVFLIRFES